MTEPLQFSSSEVQKLARLSRIAVSPAEAAQLTTEFDAIFSVIAQMQSVDTQGVAPLAHPTAFTQEVALRLREDVVTQTNQREALMQNAPAQEDGLFLVPRVIE